MYIAWLVYNLYTGIYNFHSCTMHLDTIIVFVYQPMHDRVALKEY